MEFFEENLRRGRLLSLKAQRATFYIRIHHANYTERAAETGSVLRRMKDTRKRQEKVWVERGFTFYPPLISIVKKNDDYSPFLGSVSVINRDDDDGSGIGRGKGVENETELLKGEGKEGWEGEKRGLPRREATAKLYDAHAAELFHSRLCLCRYKGVVDSSSSRETEDIRGGGRILDTPRDTYEIFMGSLAPLEFTPFVRAESKVGRPVSTPPPSLAP